jgi:hypothetical protein
MAGLASFVGISARGAYWSPLVGNFRRDCPEGLAGPPSNPAASPDFCEVFNMAQNDWRTREMIKF